MSQRSLTVLPDTPLPAKSTDLIDYRKNAEPSLPDELERACRQFYETDGFKAMMAARTDDEAIEGSILLDDTMAVDYLRQMARKTPGYFILPKTPLKKARACFRRSTYGRRLLGLNRQRRLEQALLALSQAAPQPPAEEPPVTTLDVGE